VVLVAYQSVIRLRVADDLGASQREHPTLPHFMPLSTQVLAILRELHSLTGARVALSVP